MYPSTPKLQKSTLGGLNTITAFSSDSMKKVFPSIVTDAQRSVTSNVQNREAKQNIHSIIMAKANGFSNLKHR